MMKTCPVCGSSCFDDMAICYGCMHDFSRDKDSDSQGVSSMVSSSRPALELPLVIADDELNSQRKGRHAVNLDVTVRVEGPGVCRREEFVLGHSAEH